MHQSQISFSTKLAALYGLGKLRWLHPLLSDRLQGSLLAAMDADDASRGRGGMEHARHLAVFEEDLAALHGLAFLYLHPRLHAGKVVGEDGDSRAGGRTSHDLKRFPGNREVEALLDLVQCHVRSVSMPGPGPGLGRLEPRRRCGGKRSGCAPRRIPAR